MASISSSEDYFDAMSSSRYYKARPDSSGSENVPASIIAYAKKHGIDECLE